MTITLTQHGVNYSIETNKKFDATEALEMFTNLMKCAGWAQVH
jgi:hypothetical protein